MTEAFEVMRWPLLACLLLPGLLVYLGLHIVEREIIFVDLALAQVAALGNCVAILLGHDAHDWPTYAWAASFTVIGAAIFTATRAKKLPVPQEALIGIVYVVAAAAGILLLSRSAEGNEELRRTLVGDVLLVRPAEVLRTFALFALVAVVHWGFRRQFMALSFGPSAEASGSRWWDFLFYVLFGFVVTSFVQIGGVLLAFSYLIVPAVCGKLLAGSLRARLLTGWAAATVASVIGLGASYAGDWPTGAAIVCTLGCVCVACGAGALLRRRATAGST
jgi:zinc/manganese transport system permease protein